MLGRVGGQCTLCSDLQREQSKVTVPQLRWSCSASIETWRRCGGASPEFPEETVGVGASPTRQAPHFSFSGVNWQTRFSYSPVKILFSNQIHLNRQNSCSSAVARIIFLMPGGCGRCWLGGHCSHGGRQGHRLFWVQRGARR